MDVSKVPEGLTIFPWQWGQLRGAGQWRETPFPKDLDAGKAGPERRTAVLSQLLERNRVHACPGVSNKNTWRLLHWSVVGVSHLVGETIRKT